MLYLALLQIVLYVLFILSTRNLKAYSENLKAWCKVRTSVKTFVLVFLLQMIPLIGIVLWFTQIRSLYFQFKKLLLEKQLETTGFNWLIETIKFMDKQI